MLGSEFPIAPAELQQIKPILYDGSLEPARPLAAINAGIKADYYLGAESVRNSQASTVPSLRESGDHVEKNRTVKYQTIRWKKSSRPASRVANHLAASTFSQLVAA
jgi:hypothetical protein